MTDEVNFGLLDKNYVVVAWKISFLCLLSFWLSLLIYTNSLVRDGKEIKYCLQLKN